MRASTAAISGFTVLVLLVTLVIVTSSPSTTNLSASNSNMSSRASTTTLSQPSGGSRSSGYSTNSTNELPCGKAQEVNINGTKYCRINVTPDSQVVSQEGYAYFLNGSITFKGVTFATSCPPNIAGCPNTGSTSIQTYTSISGPGAIIVNITFPNHTTETIHSLLDPGSDYTILSSHSNPRAGVFVQASSTIYLLVEES